MGKLSRPSLVESVTDELKEFIASDAVEVNQKLPSENELCRKYNVSRTTIREALRVLQATGYVELLPNRGAFVSSKAKLSPADADSWMHFHAPEVLEVLEVRLVLEPMAARLAAQRGTSTELFAIKGLSAIFETVASQEYLAEMVSYDEQFHEAIMAATHNDFLVDISRLMTKSLRGYRGRTFTIDKNGALSVPAHNGIAQAIVDRDGALAEQLMREHMECNISIIHNYTP